MIRALRLGIPILIIILAVTMFSVSPVLAAQGGHHHPPPGCVPLTVSPNPVPLHTTFTISGCGYSGPVLVGISGYFDFVWLIPDSSGTFSITHQGLTYSGTYYVQAWGYVGKNWTKLAELPFTTTP